MCSSDLANKFAYTSGRYALQILQDTTSGAQSFRVSNATGSAGGAVTWTTAMTLDASGNLLVGTTSGDTSIVNTKFWLSNDAGTTKWGIGPTVVAPTNFYVAGKAGSYGVYLNGTTATSWSSASDERVKDIIEPITNAAEKICLLRTVIGKYKTDETNTRKAFLIAQDVQAVLPEAVNVQPDEQGTLGLAYSDLIPLLVAAIKEQQAIIESLKARIDAANI